MSETTAPLITTTSRVYLIIALFVALTLCLVLLFQIQIDALTAIRAYVGGEGLWAKAQKDAVYSIEHYAVSRDEADYQAYLRLIQVPLGDRKARIELQKENPDIAVAQAGLVQGRNHPDDLDPIVRFFRRFQHSGYMSQVIEHWTTGDRMIAELNGVVEALHEEIASGRNNPDAIRSYLNRIDDINRHVTVEEDLFSSTLAAASRWANDVSRNLTYAIALLFIALGVGLSWPIITRIRATENSLLESEARFRGIFEHVDDIIYTVEADGTISSISPSSERILGWQPSEWIGRPFPLIVYPDDLPHMQELFLKAQAGESLPVFQVRILTKAGGYLDTEIAANPIHHGGGFTILGVVRDITERKRAAEALRLSTLKYQLLFEKSRDALMVIALPSWKFTTANEAAVQLFGATSVAELTARMPWELSPERQPDGRLSSEKVSEITAIILREGFHHFEWEHQRLDGQLFAADVMLIRMELGGELFLQATVRDITERKQNEALKTKVLEQTQQLLDAQNELVRKEKLAVLGQIAGSVGHELRNPLGVMSNAVYFLQTVLPDADDSVKEYLDIIKSEISGSERIVSDLLDSVRTKPPHPENAGARELLEKTLGKCAVPSAVTVKLGIPGTLSPLYVDPHQIHQVFRNLVSNGIEAMPEGGVLDIRASEDAQAGTITISVRDSGSGISPEALAKLFQPLFTTKARGIGLGLVVVKNLTEANGGTVEVQSEPAKGTSFLVTFPTGKVVI